MLDTTARNVLIRHLRSMGWSLRCIAHHEQVGISAEAVRKILAAGPPVELPDDGDVVTLGSPEPGREPPVGPLEFVGVNDEGVALFVDSKGWTTEPLELYREAHRYPHDHPRARQCWEWPTRTPRRTHTGPARSSCGPIGPVSTSKHARVTFGHVLGTPCGHLRKPP